jgi:hypothetical protein
MNEPFSNRFSAVAPIGLALAALLAVLNARHASHEDGWWHVWMLMLLLQLPLIGYFLYDSRRELRRAMPVLAFQIALFCVGLFVGRLHPGW